MTEFLKGELDRLVKLEGELKNDELRKSMPSYEWDMIWTWQKALVTALKTIIETVEDEEGMNERLSSSEDVSSSDDEGTHT